jgi:hypothetical protein
LYGYLLILSIIKKRFREGNFRCDDAAGGAYIVGMIRGKEGAGIAGERFFRFDLAM